MATFQLHRHTSSMSGQYLKTDNRTGETECSENRRRIFLLIHQKNIRGVRIIKIYN